MAEPTNVTVLVIDDSSDMRLILDRMLTHAGFTVATADCGHAGVALATSAASVDLVLLDIQMPDVDGWETLLRIRSDRRTRRMPVVMCTSETQPEAALLSWILGCDGYVLKPVDVQTLASTIRGVLERDEWQRDALRSEYIARLKPIVAARLATQPGTVPLCRGDVKRLGRGPLLRSDRETHGDSGDDAKPGDSARR